MVWPLSSLVEGDEQRNVAMHVLHIFFWGGGDCCHKQNCLQLGPK